MKKFILVVCMLAVSVSSFANETDVTTTDLLIAQKWLFEKPSNWKLLYNEIDGKKYQWVITKQIYGDDIQVHFQSGNEIDDSGQVIGEPARVSDQFFTLIIDKETYQLKNVYLGG